MDDFLLGLLLVVGIVLVLLIVLFFALIFYRLREVKNKNKIKNYIEHRRVDWFDYLLGEDVDGEMLKPKSMIEMEAIDELFFRISYHFASDEITNKVNKFAEQYMNDYYVKRLNSRNGAVRINTLNKIYLFNLLFMLDSVSKQLQQKKVFSKGEYLLIYTILAKFSETDFVAHFMNPKVPLGEFDYKKLLMELNEDQIRVLTKEFNQLPEILQLNLVEIVGVRHYLNWLPLLHYCLDSPIRELRIRSLKSIAELEVADSLLLYEKFAYSAVWEERLMTAKIFRSAPTEDALPVLNQLIKDSKYPVRAQAAKSMKSLKNGQQALYSVITTSSDTFAVDAAEEMLGKE